MGLDKQFVRFIPFSCFVLYTRHLVWTNNLRQLCHRVRHNVIPVNSSDMVIMINNNNQVLHVVNHRNNDYSVIVTSTILNPSAISLPSNNEQTICDAEFISYPNRWMKSSIHKGDRVSFSQSLNQSNFPSIYALYHLVQTMNKIWNLVDTIPIILTENIQTLMPIIQRASKTLPIVNPIL